MKWSPTYPSLSMVLLFLKIGISFGVLNFNIGLNTNYGGYVDILTVRINLFKFSPSISEEDLCCPICNGPPESVQHILLGCILPRPFGDLLDGL
ncbi:hypothetical protein SLA2020_442380 [Shorea laevis]